MESFPRALSIGANGPCFSRKAARRRKRLPPLCQGWGPLLPFLLSMSKDDYQYLGAGKTISDDRTIVFWHRTDDRQIRAIYNDLTVAVIKETDLPASK